MAPRNTYRYVLRGVRDNRVKYAGVTNDPPRRAAEHGRGRMEVRGPRVTRESALNWEQGYIRRVQPPWNRSGK